MTDVLYCPCDGDLLGLWVAENGDYRRHSAEPCVCESCADAPNYCAVCGVFLRNTYMPVEHSVVCQEDNDD